MYYCDCQGPALDGALDRFASFFICPLLGEGSVSREIQAVDSEHAKNVTSDHWRLDHLSRTVLGRVQKPEDSDSIEIPQAKAHPYASFGSGNRESLEKHFTVSVTGTSQRWILELVPREPRLREQISMVRLHGQHTVVREVTIAMADGDRSVMTIEPVAAANKPASSIRP